MGSEIKSGYGFLEERVEFDIPFNLNHFWDLVAASGDSRFLMGISTIRFEINHTDY